MITPKDLLDNPKTAQYATSIKCEVAAKFSEMGLVFDEAKLYSDILDGIATRYKAGDREVIDKLLYGESTNKNPPVGLLSNTPNDYVIVDSLRMLNTDPIHIAAANFNKMNTKFREASNRLAENMRELNEGLKLYPNPYFMMQPDEQPKMYGKSEANDQPRPISDRKRAKARKKRKKAKRAARGRK